MKNDAVVIYNSQTGFTKKYAEWISEAAGIDCMELDYAKKTSLDEYGIIIFGDWACAGMVSKLKWFKENMSKWENKKLAVFCVGGSPIDNPDIEKSMNNWFSTEERKCVSLFYCPGGFNYEKMPVKSKIMMKMFSNALKSKKNKTDDEALMAEMISKSYDISDRKYIEPILIWINDSRLHKET